MLAVADRQQGFFDAVWCSNLLPEGSIYSLLPSTAIASSAMRTSPIVTRSARAGPRSRRACSPRCCCSPTATGSRTSGRWTPSASICAGRSRSICRSTIPGFHPTSLVRFRARLLLHGKERLVFERSLELATELGLLSGPAEQILDSTPMLGAAAVQDTATLVRSGVRKLIDAVRAADRKGRRRAHFGASLRLLAPAREAGRRLAGQGRPRGAPRRGREGRGAGAAGGRGGRRARGRGGDRRGGEAAARDRGPGVRARR